MSDSSPSKPSPSEGNSSFGELHDQYRDLLLNSVVPYWSRHAIDHECGGVFSCLREDGSRISTDKYLWSQCRAIWTFAALYNRVERRPEFLEVARRTAEFVLRHGRDKRGRFVFQTTREGEVVQGAISVYTDYFAVYGLGELCRATGEQCYLDEALKTFLSTVARIREPGFDGFAPYARPERIARVHGMAMMGLETAQELGETVPEPAVFQWVDECLRQIMEHHVRPGRRLLLEHLDSSNEEVDSPAGRAVVPGHAIESMWFVLHQARRRKDAGLIRRATEVIHWMIEAGWDAEKGGLFLGIDANGGKPWWKHAEKKLWWPHTEALYALLLSYELTGEAWCLDWYWKVHEWAFAHFPDQQHGEWHQKLDREGRVIDEVIALPVKDPFHLPRTLILALPVLQRLSMKKSV